ncbi:MAG TPA: hypothetical protein VK020_05350, partial [Microlunatus sp.]|nr:hypothetical protein [Microlunatus sp.]
AEPSRHTTVPRATATQFRPPPDAPAEQHEGTGFTFTTPTGWARSPKWGERNDGLIVDSEGNQITIYIFEQDEPRSRCQKELKALEVWVPGAISELPDRKIDGKLAPGGQLDGTRETYQMRCALANRSIYNISLEIKNGDVEKSTAALDEVLDSWKWKS